MFRADVGRDEAVASFDNMRLCRVSTHGHYSQDRTKTSHTATHDTQLFRFTFADSSCFLAWNEESNCQRKFYQIFVLRKRTDQERDAQSQNMSVYCCTRRFVQSDIRFRSCTSLKHPLSQIMHVETR